MRIGIDIDGVLSDYMSSLNNHVNSVLGTSFKYSDYSDYDFNKVWGLSKDQAGSLLRNHDNSPQLAELSVIEGAKESVNQLRKENDLYVVTSRDTKLTETTLAWINKHFSSTFEEVCFSTLKGTPPHKGHKVDLCKKLRLDYLIEDALHFAKTAHENNIKVLLFDQPWNQGSLPAGLKRYHSWAEVASALATKF